MCSLTLKPRPPLEGGGGGPSLNYMMYLKPRLSILDFISQIWRDKINPKQKVLGLRLICDHAHFFVSGGQIEVVGSKYE